MGKKQGLYLIVILLCIGFLPALSKNLDFHPSTTMSDTQSKKSSDSLRILVSGDRILDDLDYSIAKVGENMVVSLAKQNKSMFLEKKYIFANTGDKSQITLADSENRSQHILITGLSQAGAITNKEHNLKINYRGKIEDILLDKKRLEEDGYLKKDKIPVIITLKIEKNTKIQEFDSVKSQVTAIINKDSTKDFKIKRDLPLINAISAEISEKKIQELEKIPLVERISLDRKVHALLDESVPLINATQLWQTKDSEGRNITGVNTTIAIIDTGVDYNHPDLGGCLGPSCKVYGGYDFANDDSDPIDDYGHGTHCAGIAAGNGLLKGVAPDAKILAVKVLNSGGSGSFSTVIAGIQYAVDPNQDGNYSDHVDVISMSLGGPGDPDDDVSTAVDTAVEKGVVVVVAAGNSGPYAETIGSPGCARDALTIGAMCKPNQVGNESYCDSLIASFSSRGPTSTGGIKPDVVAPGVKICSARWDDYEEGSECFDEEHIRISGTSMATPHAAGAAALLKQAHPDWSSYEIKSALMETAEDLGFGLNTQGTGKIDVFRASNARITTIPQSISFGYANSSFFSADVIIKNLRSNSTGLNLTVSLVTDDKGNNYSIASVNASSLVISGNSQAVVLLSVNLSNGVEGIFEGKINIVDEDGAGYVIPFSFTKLSSLNVKLDGGDTLLHPDFYLHDNNLSIYRSASQGSDFEGDSTTFRIPSGNYTVYALGDTTDPSTEYILMDSVEVPISSEANITLKLSDARPFTIKARALDGRNLKLYEWEKALSTYKDGRVYQVFYIDPNIGDRVVYVSNKPNNTLDTDITFRYYGIPVET